jgi:hypothetical protein
MSLPAKKGLISSGITSPVKVEGDLPTAVNYSKIYAKIYLSTA